MSTSTQNNKTRKEAKTREPIPRRKSMNRKRHWKWDDGITRGHSMSYYKYGLYIQANREKHEPAEGRKGKHFK